jgi:hypothetical protein
MESIGLLKEITCLLSCQPPNLDCQVQAALECLCAAVGMLAIGIFWPAASGRLPPRDRPEGVGSCRCRPSGRRKMAVRLAVRRLVTLTHPVTHE